MIRRAGDCNAFLFLCVRSYLCFGEGDGGTWTVWKRRHGVPEVGVETPKWGGSEGIANDCFDAAD